MQKGSKGIRLISLWCAIAFSNVTCNAQVASFATDGVEYRLSADGDAMVYAAESNVQHVEIPEWVDIDGTLVAVTKIFDGAFAFCSDLRTVTLPKSITQIGDYAFYDCYALEVAALPDDVTTVGVSAFEGCSSLLQMSLSASMEKVGDYAFRNCSQLCDIEIGSFSMEIGVGSFLGCGFKGSAYVPDNITAVPIDSYSLSGVNYAELGDNVTEISDGAFRDCNCLEGIVIPESVKRVGVAAFENCGELRSLEFPEGVETIGECALWECASLGSIDISATVANIGDWAFAGCSGLWAIFCHNSVPLPIDETVMEGVSREKCHIVVPTEAIQAYASAPVWKEFIHITDDISAVETVAANSCDELILRDSTIIAKTVENHPLEVYTIQGHVLYYGYEREVRLPDNGIYIARLGKAVKKFLIQ